MTEDVIKLFKSCVSTTETSFISNAKPYPPTEQSYHFNISILLSLHKQLLVFFNLFFYLTLHLVYLKGCCYHLRLIKGLKGILHGK